MTAATPAPLFRRVLYPDGAGHRALVFASAEADFTGAFALREVGRPSQKWRGCDCPACPCHGQTLLQRRVLARVLASGWRWRYDPWVRAHYLEPGGAPAPPAREGDW